MLTKTERMDKKDCCHDPKPEDIEKEFIWGMGYTFFDRKAQYK